MSAPNLHLSAVRSFRFERHGLSLRRPGADLEVAVGVAGIEDFPPGSALPSLAARIREFRPGQLEQALAARSVVKLWSVRAAPYVVPTADAAVFTTGLRPDNEADRLAFIRGATAHLARFGLTASSAAELTRDALVRVLDGRELTKDQLGRELAAIIERSIPAALRSAWNEPDGLRDNRYGESICRWALYLVALDGLFVLGSNGRATTFRRADQWLGTPLPSMDATAARAELVVRFLRCYGPSTAPSFASWTGTSARQAAASWALVRDRMVEVTLRGRRRWLLAEDVAAVENASSGDAIRLLPPHDPWLQQPDRADVLDDAALRRDTGLRRRVPGPAARGVLVVGGTIAGTWRPRAQGARLEIFLEPFDRPSKSLLRKVTAEAQLLGQGRGATSVDLRIAP